MGFERHRVGVVAVVAWAALAGCPHPTTVGPPRPVGPPKPPRQGPGEISWKRVEQPADVPAEPPPAGTWRIHMIDVGSGLSILVQGPDFVMLFDGGSIDGAERPLRVVDYLETALGPSGDGACRSSREEAPGKLTIDHVVLSHPHMDHASALELVLHCYDVKNVWDSGAINHAAFYRDFLVEVSHLHGATYHTAIEPRKRHTITVRDDAVVIPPAVPWVTFREGDQVTLGQGAGFEILHAEGKAHDDPNQNSIVLAVDLGRTRLLLTGDAESGERRDPSAPPGDVEEHLLDHFRAEIDADILQVGHHGSLTSSRARFLRAVSPTLALVSAGPKHFGRVVLPDAEVIQALHATGATVLRTDEHDAACDLAQRIGPDHGPGGCDSYVITVTDPPIETGGN